MRYFRTGLASLLAVALTTSAMAQETDEQPQYRLIVVRGENAQHNIKKGRATRPVVEVGDRNNKPVARILITFTLPQNGASGTFVNGAKLYTATTNASGQASAAVQPNTVSGNFNISVSAKVNGQTLNAQIPQANVAAAAGIAVAVTLGSSGTMTRLPEEESFLLSAHAQANPVGSSPFAMAPAPRLLSLDSKKEGRTKCGNGL